MMRFREAVTVCFQDYWTFSGRASRAEYWWFFLFLVAGRVLLEGVDAVLFGEDRLLGLSGLFAMFTFLPQVAVAWRRMHDTGLPGWVNLVPAIPLVPLVSGVLGGSGAAGRDMVGSLLIAAGILTLAVLVMLARPSQRQSNRYGPLPPR